MKIRIGFVSNSSTSSFLIYGVCVPPEECKDIGDFSDVYEKAKKLGLTANWPSLGYDDVPYYVGISWDDVKDDETGKEFKKRAENLLKQLFGKKMKCSTHQEAWRDG